MEITINGKSYVLFGRKPVVPQRETSIVYEGGYYYGSKNIESTISKQMSEEVLRSFSKQPVCRRAIEIIKSGVLSLPWAIEKRNQDDERDFSKEIAIIQDCINNPNYTDTYRSLFGSAIEDMCVGDCGTIEICESVNPDKPLWLYPVDGFTIRINTGFVKQPTDIRYSQTKSNGSEIKLADQDLMYLKKNDFTNTPLGLGAVESAFHIINYLLETQRYASVVTSKAVPKFILNLGKNIDTETLLKFRKYFDEEVYGSGKTPLVGGSEGIKAEQIAASTDDGLYLQWQHFLTVIIAYTFGIDPKRFNEGSQTDRSTVEEQRENILDEAIKPIAEVIAENINKKIINRLGLGQDLVFRYIYEDNESRKKQKSDRVLNEYNSDLLTLNEARLLLGYDEADDKFGNMLKSEIKNELNTKYALDTQTDTGGFNGQGKNRYE